MAEIPSFQKLELSSTDKTKVFEEVAAYLNKCGLKVVNSDSSRPWGGFFVIEETQAALFGRLFFPEIDITDLRISGKLSPKILLVESKKRLSWQYHFRRAEIWRIISGRVGVVTSDTDEESEVLELKNVGDTVRLSQGQRHRLVGLNGWGVVAEIWQHTDIKNPSDEEDIVRLQDDFGR